MGVSEATFYVWKKEYANLAVNRAQGVGLPAPRLRAISCAKLTHFVGARVGSSCPCPSSDPSSSQFAQAALQFRCLADGNTELARSNLHPVPNVRIENRTK